MGLSEKDIDRLGPAARAQIAAALNHAAARKETLRPKRADEFESALEARYYETEIAPRIYAGLIDTVETHKEFLLMPAGEYCGLSCTARNIRPIFSSSTKTARSRSSKSRAKPCGVCKARMFTAAVCL